MLFPAPVTERSPLERVLLLAFAIVALINLGANLASSSGEWLIFSSKVLLVPLLTAWLLVRTRETSPVLPRAFLLPALGFSWLGDIALGLPGSGFFLAGMVAFGLAHLCYLRAFLSGLKPRRLPVKRAVVYALPFVVYGYMMYSVVSQSMSSGGHEHLRLPVLLYMVVLLSSGVSSFLRQVLLCSQSATSILVGHVLFTLSDTLIALIQFGEPLPGGGFAVMATYILGQFLIIHGGLPTPKARGPRRDDMKVVTSKRVSNWFNDLHTYPLVIAYPTQPSHLQRIVQERSTFPSPLRAVGSLHSTTACFGADTGTVVVMKGFRSMSLGEDAEGNPTVTAGAGARFFEVAEFLRDNGLQFYVNVEIGDLTMGAAACVGTKESAFPGEHGQVGSYLHSVKMINARGEVVEISGATRTPDLRTVRSSYGLLGLVYEVTFKVKKLRPMAVHHRTFTLGTFLEFLKKELPALERQGTSMMLYLDPFTREHLFTGPRGLITAEFRRYTEAGRGKATRWQWWLRNFAWKSVCPRLAHGVSRLVWIRPVRHALLNTLNWLNHFFLRTFIRGRHTLAPDQIIRYPAKGGPGKYTFSILAFPEKDYARVLSSYFEFCRDYEARTGYRTNLLHVGYRTFQDRSSLLSYSYAGNAMTADPVATGTAGWQEFLVAYHAFADGLGGIPLFNQTPWVTAASARRAFGVRLQELAWTRAQQDPSGRFLSPFFHNLLSEPLEQQEQTLRATG